MPKYIGEVIDTINYNAEFNYDFDVLINNVPQDDANACRQYKVMIDEHIQSVQSVWFQNAYVEATPRLHFWTASGPSEGWGDYIRVSHADHGDYTSDPIQPRSLRDIAREEFNVSDSVIDDIDHLINLHDRSRYSEDEFYAAANYFFSSSYSDLDAFRRSQLKHYQRNGHEFTHYMYHTETGPTRTIVDEDGRERRFYTAIVLQMPEHYMWCRIAVWLANFDASGYRYNNNNGLNPFQYYWGKDSNYKWVWVPNEDGDGGHWEKVEDDYGPEVPEKVEINYSVRNRIERIVDRWSQVIPMPEDEE